MFFGLNERPSDEFLKGCKITKAPFNQCSRDKGKCRGSLPRMVDGEQKVQYVYYDEMPTFEWTTREEYWEQFEKYATFDDGEMVTKCSTIKDGHTFSWFE